MGTPSPHGDETGRGAGDLGGAGAAQLFDALVDEVEAVDVGLAEPAAPGVHRQPPADLQRAALGERAALAAPAEAVALQRERYEGGERVVDLGDVHILWSEVGVLPQMPGGGPGGAGERVVVPVVDHAVVLGGQALGGGVDVDGGVPAVAGALPADDHARQGAVGLQAVVEEAEGFADPAGGHVHLAGQGRSYMIASGFWLARLRQARATLKRWSRVAPYSCMYRRASIAISSTGRSRP